MERPNCRRFDQTEIMGGDRVIALRVAERSEQQADLADLGMCLMMGTLQ